jgi:hypothetical protein
MLQVVAFHVEPSKAAAEAINRSCRTFHAEQDYLSLLDLLFRSARLHDRTAECVVLTDVATAMPLEDRVRVVRAPVDADRVMFSRLQAQIKLLEESRDDCDRAFLDADMLINRPLAPLFDDDFDLGLTYRANAEMPINGGVILVKRGRRAAAIEFLSRVCEVYATHYADQQHWWGDQRALIDVLGRERFDRRSLDKVNVGGVAVRLLPCDEYNFSPENEPRCIAAPLRDKVILHFKGERKRLMPLYWEAHLAARDERSWGAFWKARRARASLRRAA